jgi:hypothetical protein
MYCAPSGLVHSLLYTGSLGTGVPVLLWITNSMDIKKFPTFYEIGRAIKVFTGACH